MAGTTHLYAGVAATVGMEHQGTLGGIFRQEAGGGKWEQLKSGLADGAEDAVIPCGVARRAEVKLRI